jgi:hypothetical protein
MMKSRNDFSIKRRYLRKILIGVVMLALLAAAALGFNYWRSLPSEQPETVPAESQTTHVATETYTPTVVEGCQPAAVTSRPYLMSIPALDIVNVCIEFVGSGKRAAGQLDDPADTWKFGWFKRSAAPGVDGQGVYTCHSGYGDRQSLCDNLSALSDGAEIILENARGKKFTYQIVEIKITPLQDVDMAEFQSVPAGHSQGISLMTCIGDWDNQLDTMKDRLTVRAVIK